MDVRAAQVAQDEVSPWGEADCLAGVLCSYDRNFLPAMLQSVRI